VVVVVVVVVVGGVDVLRHGALRCKRAVFDEEDGFSGRGESGLVMVG
jgi:hypothetical protein